MATKIQQKAIRTFFYNKDLTEQEYKKSQLRMILSGPTAGIIFSLTSGSFFIGYLVYLGAPAQYCTIIGAIPQFGCILQMISPYLFERMKHRKLLICLCCFLFRFSVSTMILVPMLVDNGKTRLTIIMVVYTFSFMIAGFVTPGLNQWYLSVAPEQNRGRFLAIKDIASMFSVSVVSIAIGRIMDHYKSFDKAFIGFAIMYGVALAISVIDFILISKIEEPLVQRVPLRQSLIHLIKMPMKNIEYRKIISFLSIWGFAVQFSTSFIPVYMISILNLSYSYISVVTVCGNTLGMISIYLWGRLADRTSWFRLLKISSFIIVFCYVGWVLVTPQNSLIVVFILQISLTCCNGAFQMASSNLQYNLSPEAGKTAYLGITSAIACVISFVGAMLGSIVCKTLGNVEIRLLTLRITNIQIIFLITGLLLTTAFLYVRRQNHFKES